jgi:hypothetical protein
MSERMISNRLGVVCNTMLESSAVYLLWQFCITAHTCTHALFHRNNSCTMIYRSFDHLCMYAYVYLCTQMIKLPRLSSWPWLACAELAVQFPMNLPNFIQEQVSIFYSKCLVTWHQLSGFLRASFVHEWMHAKLQTAWKIRYIWQYMRDYSFGVCKCALALEHVALWSTKGTCSIRTQQLSKTELEYANHQFLKESFPHDVFSIERNKISTCTLSVLSTPICSPLCVVFHKPRCTHTPLVLMHSVAIFPVHVRLPSTDYGHYSQHGRCRASKVHSEDHQGQSYRAEVIKPSIQCSCRVISVCIRICIFLTSTFCERRKDFSCYVHNSHYSICVLIFLV